MIKTFYLNIEDHQIFGEAKILIEGEGTIEKCDYPSGHSTILDSFEIIEINDKKYIKAVFNSMKSYINKYHENRLQSSFEEAI